MFGAKSSINRDEASGRRETGAREAVIRKVRVRVFGTSPRTSALQGWRATFLPL